MENNFAKGNVHFYTQIASPTNSIYLKAENHTKCGPIFYCDTFNVYLGSL